MPKSCAILEQISDIWEGLAVIRLIASDIDGTLLQNGKRELNPELFDQIERLWQHGILFCAASGRQYLNLKQLFAPVADKVAFIAENGALVMKQETQIAVQPMPRKESLLLIEEILSHKGCEVQVSGKEQVYISPRNKTFVEHIRGFVKNKTVLCEDFSNIKEPFLKVSLMMMDGVDDETLEFFSRKWGGIFNVALSGSCWVDFTVANKADGLTALCETLGISLSETAAFGDNYNDMEMLHLAKYSWAMTKADDAVKQVAGRTCNRVEPVLQSILEALDETE